MDTEIATMVTAFIGFSAAGLISWRKLIVRSKDKDCPASPTPEASANTSNG
jgi:hypothetical protein